MIIMRTVFIPFNTKVMFLEKELFIYTCILFVHSMHVYAYLYAYTLYISKLNI